MFENFGWSLLCLSHTTNKASWPATLQWEFSLSLVWLWLTYIVYWSPFFTLISFHCKQTWWVCVYIIETRERESLHNSLLTSFVSSWILPSGQIFIISAEIFFHGLYFSFLFLRCTIKACHPLSNDYLMKILQAQSPEGKMDYNIKGVGHILPAGLCILFVWREGCRIIIPKSPS